jgi:hypothetical protein
LTESLSCGEFVFVFEVCVDCFVFGDESFSESLSLDGSFFGLDFSVDFVDLPERSSNESVSG